MNQRTELTRVRGCFAGFVLASAMAVTALGCSSDNARTSGGNAPVRSEAVGDRRIPFSPMNDREFAQFFAEHHQMAIDAATMEAANGANADAKALAKRIIDSQTAELQVLNAALVATTDEKELPPAPSDPHMQAEMDHMMVLSGAALDQMFLIDMIAHHAAALAPAHRAMDHLQRDDLQKLAGDIGDAQAREIGEMRMLLISMDAMDAGEDMATASSGRADFGLVGDRRISLTPANDVDFIDFFVPHHEAAIAMAEEEIARGSAPDIVDMARSMRDTQASEVDTMKAARQSLTGSATSPAVAADSHMDAEMATMKTLDGQALDRMFLEEMVPHHAAALPTAHRARPHLKNGDLSALAVKMFDAQSKEIGDMQNMVENF
jgi:uncharacterized protein (DUF305 family)